MLDSLLTLFEENQINNLRLYYTHLAILTELSRAFSIKIAYVAFN
jgi:hypothetical protein